MIAFFYRLKENPLSENLIGVLDFVINPIKKNLLFFLFILVTFAPAPLTSIVQHFGEIGCVIETVTGLCGGMAWAYLLTVIVGCAGSRRVRALLMWLFMLVGIVLFLGYAELRYGFGKFVTPVELTTLLATTPAEINDFFSTFFNAWIALAIAVLFFAGIIVYKSTRYIYNFAWRLPEWLRNASKMLLAILLTYGFYDLFLILSLFSYDGEPRVNWGVCWRIGDHNGDTLSKLIYSGVSVRESRKLIREWSDVNRQAYGTPVSTSSHDDLKIVMILGESFIKSHSSLYGYPLETNPRLSSERDSGRLVVFDDVVASSNFTIDMVRAVFCTHDASSDEEDWYQAPFFPVLFAKAGWNIYYWDNQTLHKGDRNIFNFTMMEFLFNDFLVDSCYTRLYDHPYEYDMEFVEDFARNVTITDGNELAIFHLMGQHINASHRYPHTEEFTRFDGHEIRRDEPWMSDEIRTWIANYDNATYYNDYVVNEIIDLYRDRNSVVFYFSDHGEEVYDYRNSQGRKTCPENRAAELSAQYSIPFFIWMSDKFVEMQPEKAGMIRESAGRPFMSDYVDQMIMGLSDMETDYYRPELDPLSDKYAAPRRVLHNGLDYDEVVR